MYGRRGKVVKFYSSTKNIEKHLKYKAIEEGWMHLKNLKKYLLSLKAFLFTVWKFLKPSTFQHIMPFLRVKYNKKSKSQKLNPCISNELIQTSTWKWGGEAILSDCSKFLEKCGCSSYFQLTVPNSWGDVTIV